MLLQKLKIDLLGKKNKNTLLTLKRGNKIFLFFGTIKFSWFSYCYFGLSGLENSLDVI